MGRRTITDDFDTEREAEDFARSHEERGWRVDGLLQQIGGVWTVRLSRPNRSSAQEGSRNDD